MSSTTFAMQNWICTLFFLCSAASVSQCCDWRGYDRLTNESLALLDQLGEKMTDQECPVTFPQKLYDHIEKAKREEKVAFLRISVDRLLRLYTRNMEALSEAAVSWDRQKLDHLLILLHRMTQDLQACGSSRRKRDYRVERYYKKLERVVLRNKNYSSNAWEIIRHESRKNIAFLHLLLSPALRAPIDQ